MEQSAPPKVKQFTSLTTRQVKSLNEIIDNWPGPNECLPTVLRCHASGWVAYHYLNDKFIGMSAVELIGTIAHVHMLPQQFGKALIGEIEYWALQNSVTELRIATDRFSGQSFRYLEKTLGFHRRAVVFVKTLWQTT